MITITIRLEDDLTARIAAAAEREGKTAHGFILDAIKQAVEQSELDGEFQRIAEERWAKVGATGESVPFNEARTYLETKAKGQRAVRPSVRRRTI